MTIFVSALINLHEDRSKEKSTEERFKFFHKLEETGVRIHLFLSRDITDYYPPANVSVEYIDLHELDTYKELEGLEYSLPSSRNLHKDTANYMILMNSKIEFIHRAMKSVEATHYAWIDFSIFHVLSKEETPAHIHLLGNQPFTQGIFVPGCWNKCEPSFSKICWRFCGGFFIGDRDSIKKFYEVYRNNFKETVIMKGLAWEVNVWAWFEYTNKIEFNWYKGDHNDTILDVPIQRMHLPCEKN